MADTLKEKIDTNKNQNLEIKELQAFINNPKNLQELADHLNQNMFLGEMDQILGSLLSSSEIQNSLKEKLGKTALTESEIQILYLQYLVENPSEKLTFHPTSTDLFDKYGGSTFVNMIKKRYPSLQLTEQSLRNAQHSKQELHLRQFEQTKGISLPNLNLRNVDYYSCDQEFQRLQVWAQEYFSNEYIETRVHAIKHHTEKEKSLQDQYIKYELLQFSLKKYYETINQQHETIKKQYYATEEEYQKAMEEAPKFMNALQTISKNFPNIDPMLKKMNEITTKIEQQRTTLLGNTTEKQAAATYQKYLTETKQIIANDEIKHIFRSLDSINLNPTSEEESQETAEKLSSLQKMIKNPALQQETVQKEKALKTKYGPIIDKYEKFIQAKNTIIQSYGTDYVQRLMNNINAYHKNIQAVYKKYDSFNFETYQKYIKNLSQQGFEKHRNNINILSEGLSITNKNFPLILSKLQQAELKKLQEQQDNERRRQALKKEYPLFYQIFNTGAAAWNSTINFLAGTGFKLGAMLCNLWHDSDEMVAVYERADNWISTLTLARSQAAEEAMYSAEKGININRDNGPGLVIDGIVNMLGIVYGGGFLSGGLKTLGAGANLASKGGLFLSGFFTQLGNSYEEGFKVGLTGKSLLSYAMLSAGIQGGLELISPNEFLLGQGNSVVKQYLKEILKSGNKQNLIQVGKLFLKHIGTEMVKEDAQESLQLAAGNLINLRANDQFDLGNGFDVNWDRKNFAATAIITSLTTGIVAGVGFKNHHNNHHPIKQYLQNNPQLYTQVMQTLHQSINGEQHIPNITKEDLIQLQKELEIGGFHKFDGEIQFEIPLKNGKCEYLTVGPHGELIEASLSTEEATACFKNGLTTTGKLFEGYENRCILSSGSLFLNNPEYRKLGGDIDVATDVQTFEAIALQKGKQGRTKLEEYQQNGKIRDLMFTDISHHQLTISDLSPEEISTLIARGDIRVEFNIIDDNGHLINCEFFPEPKGFGLIQVGTERTQGKINTYNLEGTTLQTVNPELAAMSYIVNLAHEAENNTLATFIQTNGKGKFKDSVRINNLFQYLQSAGIYSVQDIKDFIEKTKQNYAKQIGTEQMITTKEGTKIINQSQYLEQGLAKLDNVVKFFDEIQSVYMLMLYNPIISGKWGTRINEHLTFNTFMKETYEFKEKCASIYEQDIITDKNLNELEDALTNLMEQIDIHNPKNFAYFYEIQVCINKYFNEILAKKYRIQKLPKIQKPQKQQYA